jgi:hypothetical protein
MNGGKSQGGAPLQQLRTLTLSAASACSALAAVLRAVPHLDDLTLEDFLIDWKLRSSIAGTPATAAAVRQNASRERHDEALHQRIRHLRLVVYYETPPPLNIAEWKRACALRLRLDFPRLRRALFGCELDPALDCILYPTLDAPWGNPTRA